MKASDSLTIAVCQMTSTDDVDANLMQIENLVERIPADAEVRLAVFPENSLYMRVREGETIRGLNLQDEVFVSLCKLARERKMHLHLTTPVRIEGHLYNTSVHVSDEGVLKTTYQKMHLFDIDLVNGPVVRESDVFRHGSGVGILEIDGWKFGESICYDLRFAELYSIYARHEVDAILIPSAFLVKTGEAHWDVLMRARAIENQCYVVAPAQGGIHRGTTHAGVRETYGQSLVVDPWGQVVARVTEKAPGVILQKLQKAEIEKVRRQIPMRDHRRIPVPF